MTVEEGDVRRHLGVYAQGWPPAAGKPPTVEDGLAFAATATGQVNAILSDKGIVTPVTVPATFVDFLTDLSAIYAAAMIAATLFPQAAGPGSSTLPEFLMRQYRQGLADLRGGDIIPADVLVTGTALARSYWTSNPEDDAGNDTSVPAFTRSMKW